MPGLIIGLIDEKGGAGKTTMSVNMAAAFAHSGLSVFLADSDPQALAYDWTVERADNGLKPEIPCEQLIEDEARKIGKSLQWYANQYDVVIVDTEGRAAKVQRFIAQYADAVVSPLSTDPGELKTLVKVEAMLNAVDLQRSREKRAPVVRIGFINKLATTPAERKIDEHYARSWWEEFPAFQLLENTISYRKSYKRCHDGGKSIYDQNDQKAIKEMNKVINELTDCIAR